MHVFAETAVEGGAAQGLGRRMLSTSSMSSLVHSRSLPSLSLLGATGVNTHNVIVKAWREGRKRTATCLAASFARYLVVPGGLAVDASRARAVCKEAAGVPLLSLGGALGRTTDYRDVEGLPAEYVFVASTSMALVAVGGSRPLVEVAEALSPVLGECIPLWHDGTFAGDAVGALDEYLQWKMFVAGDATLPRRVLQAATTSIADGLCGEKGGQCGAEVVWKLAVFCFGARRYPTWASVAASFAAAEVRDVDEESDLVSRGSLVAWVVAEAWATPSSFVAGLNRLGFDEHLEPSMHLWRDQALAAREQWTPSRDAALVRYAELLRRRLAVDSYRDIPLARVGVGLWSGEPGFEELDDVDDVDGAPAASADLAAMDLPSLRLRFSMLVSMNEALGACLPLLDLRLAHDKGSLAWRVGALRHLILPAHKNAFALAVLDATTSSQRDESDSRVPSVTVDRVQLAAMQNAHPLAVGTLSFAWSLGTPLRQGLDYAQAEARIEAQVAYLLTATSFGAAHNQLAAVSRDRLRPPRPSGSEPHYAFRVVFQGENVEGEGGPYRQFFTDVSRELAPPSELGARSSGAGHLLDGSALFVRTPNAQTGVGPGRELFVPRPAACHVPQALRCFETLGVLFGVAWRTGAVLPLPLPSLFWKMLVGRRVERRDLVPVDASFVRYLSYVRETVTAAAAAPDPAAYFSERITDRFTVVCSDGTTVDLVPGGAEREVTLESASEYLRLLERARLREARRAVAAVRRGLSSIVPVQLLAVYTWRELESRVCGARVVDIDLLQRHTEYAGLSEDDPRVQHLWTVLRRFSEADRRRFLRFAWAQERLPADDAEFERTGTRLLIKPLDVPDPDSAFPHADTCFFNLALPAYSSATVLQDRLQLAFRLDMDSMNGDTPDSSMDDMDMDGRHPFMGGGRGGRGIIWFADEDDDEDEDDYGDSDESDFSDEDSEEY
jgi:hypothetical protein